MEERRKSPRIEAEWQAHIHINDAVYTSQVRNLSLGGVELMRPESWQPELDHMCTVSFNDAVPADAFEAELQICWVTDLSIGMRFNAIKPKQKIRLNKILSSLSKVSALEDGHFVM